MMPDTSATGAMPTIVASDPPPTTSERIVSELAAMNPLGALFAMVTGSNEAARAGVRSLLRSLIDEGRRYADTATGARWSALLQESPGVTTGWMLWSHANIDFYLRNAEPMADSPAITLHSAMRVLDRVDLAALLSQLSRLAVELDAGAVTAERAQSS
jgi:hypothetical protein